jgi:hypothetical protein
MLRNPIPITPHVANIADVNLRLRVERADSVLFAGSDLRLPTLRVF